MLLLSCDKFQILTSRWREFKIKSHERDLSWLVTKLTHGEFQRWPWDLQFSLLYIILKASQSIYNPPCWSPSLSTGCFFWRMIKRMIASRWEPVFFFYSPLSFAYSSTQQSFVLFTSEEPNQGSLVYIHFFITIYYSAC